MEENGMKTPSKRVVIGRVAGAGLVAGGLALGVAACAGSPAQHETDNAHLEDGVSINTQGVSTVGQTSGNTTSGNTVSGNTSGNTISGNTSGNTISGNTAGNTVSGKTAGNTVVGFPGPSLTVTDGDAPGNTVVWFPGGAVVTVGSTFVK
jgi:hypothetical protein